MPQTNITIFYAPEDQKHFDEFVKHLKTYSSKHIGLNIQHEGKILASQNTQAQIQTMLNNAHIVILLLSIDLENSSTYDLHRQTILTLHKQNKIAVLPVRLRPYHWKDSDWDNLTSSPPSFIDHSGKNYQCVADYGNTDTAFTKVIDDVDKLIAHLQTKQPITIEPPQTPPMIANNIKQLVAQSRLKEALTLLHTNLPEHQQNDTLLLQGRLSRLEKDERLSIIDQRDANIERNRITAAILSLLDEVITNTPMSSKNSHQAILALIDEGNFVEAFAQLDQIDMGYQKAQYNRFKREFAAGLTGVSLLDFADRLKVFISTL